MAFNLATDVVPSNIGNIRILMVDIVTGDDPHKAIRFEIDVLDQNGRPIPKERRAGNLLPHLTAGQISALQQFAIDIRIQAEQQILGN